MFVMCMVGQVRAASVVIVMVDQIGESLRAERVERARLCSRGRADEGVGVLDPVSVVYGLIGEPVLGSISQNAFSSRSVPTKSGTVGTRSVVGSGLAGGRCPRSMGQGRGGIQQEPVPTPVSHVDRPRRQGMAARV